MALQRYFLPAVIYAIFLFFCSVTAFYEVFDGRYGTIGTIATIIAQAAVLWVGPFVAIVAALAFTRKSLRPSNYPRIEHLRIAGKYKYQAVRRSAEMGISPLHLRG